MSEQPGLKKLPVPGKSFKPSAHDGGPCEYPSRSTVQKFSNEEKSPARADRVVKGLKS